MKVLNPAIDLMRFDGEVTLASLYVTQNQYSCYCRDSFATNEKGMLLYQAAYPFWFWVKNSDDMKFSRYNIKFEVDCKVYVYNTLSTALVEINESIVDSIESNNISKLDSDYIHELSRLHFVVEDGANEEMEYMYYFNSMKYRMGAKSLGLIFIPTYSCNLSCPYCLQGM